MLGLLLAVLCWSGNALVARAFAGEIPPLALSFWRWCLALSLLLPFVLAPLWRHRPQLRAAGWRLLVLGGSQGASILSDVVPPALASLPEDLRRRLQVTQQCRAEDLEKVGQLYAGAGIADDLAPFFSDVAARLASAHLVISGSAAYAEDNWKRIRIGALEFRLVKGCSRCIMTTLDPLTGERSDDREPLVTLKTYRERDGEVYFGQNLLHSGPGELEVGMPIEVLE